MKKVLSLLLISLIAISFAFSDDLRLEDQGYFSAGGIVVENDGVFDPVNGQYSQEGQLLHADHANVFYQIPENANSHAMVFLHGFGQSRMGWMSTPDGRDGWNDYFLNKGYSTYLVDQPRRGEAGQTSKAASISTDPQELAWFTQFRMGRWPNFNEGSQFPQDEESINQFFRQMTPDTGDIDFAVISDALIDVFEKSGPGILLTHSQGGYPGWTVAANSENVEAVIAIEPGGYPFPEDKMPEPVDTGYYTVSGTPMSDEEFARLIEKPIIIYYGDYVDSDSDLPAERFWGAGLNNAYAFRDLVNEMGGDCTVVYLPDIGITGNSHFLFQEKNNMEIADTVYSWLSEHGLN